MRARTLAVLGALVALVLVGLVVGWAWARAPLRAALEAAREGRADEALALLEEAAGRPGHAAREAELEALVRLSRGEQDALARLESLAAEHDLAWPIPPEDVAAALLADGREDLLQGFVALAEEGAGQEDGGVLAAHAGFAAHAAARLDEAGDAYDRALEGELPAALREKVEAAAERARREQRAGRVPVVVARDGSALAWRVPETGELVVEPELEGLLTGADVAELPGVDPLDLDGRVVLTLDPLAQRHAMRLFRREKGAFVALEPSSAEILAAAGTPDVGPLAPFRPAFEPGSTLKLLTLAGYLESGRDASSVVPHECRGNDFVVEGEILYDWMPHGEVDSLERALVVSCNTVLAGMGLELGDAGLRRTLAPFGFDDGTVEGAGGELFPAGRLASEPLSGRRLARAAIGLDEIEVSPLQAAWMGLAFAGSGDLPRPRLVSEKRNVAGDLLPATPRPPALEPPFSRRTASRVGAAMREVVEAPDGTGAELARAGVPVAVKTGTTGGDGEPLNAAFVGFLPAPEPGVAFSLFTRRSGRSVDVARRVLAPFLRDAWRDLSRRTGSGPAG